MDAFDFGEWCIVSKREYWEDALDAEETSSKLAPSEDEDDFVIISEDINKDAFVRTNSCDKSYDQYFQLQNAYKDPPNIFTTVEKLESIAIVNTDSEISADDDSNENFLLTFPDSWMNASTQAKVSDVVVQEAISEDENEHFDSITPLFDYYVPTNLKMNNLGIDQAIFDEYQEDTTSSWYKSVNSIISSSCDDNFYDKEIRYEDMMQNIDYEVESCNIDDMCLEKEFHLPLMNKFWPLNLTNHET